MFCLKKKISTLIQYFSDIKRESDFKEKFNIIIIFLKKYVIESVSTLMIIDIMYSFIKNKKWISSQLFKEILIDKIHMDYDLNTKDSTDIYEVLYEFFCKSIKDDKTSYNTTDSYNTDSSSIDYDFISYICISILFMDESDFDKDPEYIVNDLGLGSGIIKKVKDISLDYEKIIDENTTCFISDIDKMIFLVVSDISKMLVKDKYYVEIQKLFYTVESFFKENDIYLDFKGSKEIFDFLMYLSKNNQITLQKEEGTKFKQDYKIFNELDSQNKLDEFFDFLIDKNIIVRINAGVLIKYRLSSFGEKLTAATFKDSFFEKDYDIEMILNLPVSYQIKVFLSLEHKNRAMFLEIIDKYLNKLNIATLECGIKYIYKNEIKEKLDIKSQDLLEKISFLRSKNFKSLNTATYTRISSILSEKD